MTFDPEKLTDVDELLTGSRRDLDSSVILIVRVTFDDDTVAERTWTWGDQQRALTRADASRFEEIPDWAVDPLKSWPHPQEPVTYSMGVEPGREQAARAWLRSI